MSILSYIQPSYSHILIKGPQTCNCRLDCSRNVSRMFIFTLSLSSYTAIVIDRQFYQHKHPKVKQASQLKQ